MYVRLLGTVLLFVHAVLLIGEALQHSPCWDEPGHLVAGIGNWQLGMFDLYRVNPPLVRVVATVPVLFARPKNDWIAYDAGVGARSERTIRVHFITANGQRILFLQTLARWACVPFSLLGGYVCLRWGRELHGHAAGILAMALWCFSPNIIAHASLITPDAGAAAIGVAAAYVSWRWLKRPSWGRAVAAGLMLGLAELTKTTWIVLFGLWPVLWVVYTLAGQQPGESPHPGPLPEGEGGRSWGRGAGQMAVILLLGVYVLNLGYGFEGSFQKLGDYGFVSEMLGGRKEEGKDPYMPEVRNRFQGTWLAGVPVPLPKNYLMGIDLQKSDFENKMWSYLRGEWRLGGWWYYYLYALAIKEPLGTWVLVFLAAGISLWPGGRCPPAIARPSPLAPGPSPLAPREVVATEVATPRPTPLAPREVVATEVATPWPSTLNAQPSTLAPQPSPLAPQPSALAARPSGYSAGWRDELVLLAPAAVVLTLVSSQTGFNHHLRYVLPIFPFVFIWISKVARAVELKHWKIASVAGAALIWSVGSSLYYYPHSLSYFNELVGGPKGGHYHLGNSNIDWGQDLLYLKRWLKKHPEVGTVALSYNGLYDPGIAGIECSAVPMGPSPQDLGVHLSADEAGPQSGWYALSINKIRSRTREYEYFLRFKPVAMAGYSIYIYHITLDEANRVRRELGLPELPADWQSRGEATINEIGLPQEGPLHRTGQRVATSRIAKDVTARKCANPI